MARKEDGQKEFEEAPADDVATASEAASTPEDHDTEGHRFISDRDAKHDVRPLGR